MLGKECENLGEKDVDGEGLMYCEKNGVHRQKSLCRCHNRCDHVENDAAGQKKKKKV